MRNRTFFQFYTQQQTRKEFCRKYGISMRVFRGQTYSKEWREFLKNQA
jgi:hypothetical protein